MPPLALVLGLLALQAQAPTVENPQSVPKPRLRIEHPSRVTSVAFSPDGKLLAAAGGSPGDVLLWDPTTGRKLRVLSGNPDWIRTLAFSPDGKMLAAGGRDKLVYVWNLDPAETARTFAGHGDEIASLVFSPDGKSLLSGQVRGDLRLWDVASSELKQVFNARRPAHLLHLDWSPDGRYFADAGSRPVVYLFDGKTGKEVGKIEGLGSYVTRVRFSPDGKILATGGFDNQVRLFSISGDPGSPPLAAKEVHGFTIDEGPDDIAFFSDGKRMAVAHRNGRCSLWTVETAERLLEFEAHPGGTRAVAISPDGLSIATGGMDRNLAVWDVKALLDRR